MRVMVSKLSISSALCTAVLAMIAAAGLAGCRAMSESVEDATAGPNLGFEVVRKGLPVNWFMYSPKTVPDADFEIQFDRKDFREGKQSLKFLVHSCKDASGWGAPGMTREWPYPPGDYAFRFWLKSTGSKWTIDYGGVSAMKGDMHRLSSADLKADSWQHVELKYTLGSKYPRLRFQLNVRSAGTLWIDGLEIIPAGT